MMSKASHESIARETVEGESAVDRAEQDISPSLFKMFRNGFQFSTRFLLILLTASCVFIGIVTQDAIDNRKAIEFLTGPQVRGDVLAYRQIWFGAFTPIWMQNAIGRSNFQTPDSISVTVALNKDGENASHNGQRIINSISRFSRLSKLDLRSRQIDMEPACYETSDLDFAPLGNLEVDELFVDTNNQFAADVVARLPSDSLNFCGCELNGPLAKSVLSNKRLHELRFQKARVTADMLLRLNEMQSLESVVFLECRPAVNSDGAFDILYDPYPENVPKPWNGLGPKAIKWMDSNLPGISIVGLGPVTKPTTKPGVVPRQRPPKSPSY